MSAQTMQKGTFSSDSDVHVTREDQSKINKFARLNAKLQDLQDEIKDKENLMKNLDDASDELLMVDDEEEPVPFMVADVFFHTPLEETKAKLETLKDELTRQMEELNSKGSRFKEEMALLKRDLYAKFGDNINLEPDED
ncbi:putative prefoldin subunit 4 [Amphibalanus amphitrite]|uniref:Prefoldin subunit 4 n=1 Tax=Amphibalanus amphitrite TaxID=1232801 RepID=A0A6A4WF80_AMPAM|nr:prefoldin subunit 4-like [Amphibalanus amphitrite]XP_043204475.1 prefoldin subunit 4-like [Amphibalanus amphitrite]XP_043204476.1 prefoldin subunit 4-like [Amphibalanus amphitrite]XP_043204477.1 prefoldin subunit 4-like [Amphibalanus amphitrite]XP_043210792.1 prefoldin subunit 4-like [Amphibalanus amphitrite]XP_043210793.1 prefoldin subunit 4-like [Amphibalanus amphitrite]XP_043210794.1 prefoldin subunit 4-like [Amphibalanus amphitrite]KAF0305385.1 putative prefoldin subunit 4 [Amphibalan